MLYIIPEIETSGGDRITVVWPMTRNRSMESYVNYNKSDYKRYPGLNAEMNLYFIIGEMIIQLGYRFQFFKLKKNSEDDYYSDTYTPEGDDLFQFLSISFFYPISF